VNEQAVAPIGCKADTIAAGILRRIVEGTPCTVYVMRGKVYTAPVDSIVAKALDDHPEPIIGTYVRGIRARDIAKDIEAWRAAA
jgi:hypothetical protein